jgi:hypothetical protein
MPITPLNLVGEQQHVMMSFDQKIAGTLLAHRIDCPIMKNSLVQYSHILELIRFIWSLAADHRRNSFEKML